MGKHLTREEREEFLIRVFSRVGGVSEAQVAIHFGISRQRGGILKMKYLRKYDVEGRLEALREKLVHEREINGDQQDAIIEEMTKQIQGQLHAVQNKSLFGKAIDKKINAKFEDVQKVYRKMLLATLVEKIDNRIVAQFRKAQKVWDQRQRKVLVQISCWGSVTVLMVAAAIWFIAFNQTQAPAEQLEQMRQALKKVVWVHLDYQTGILTGRGEWYRFGPQIVASIRRNGSAFYVNEAQGRGSSYVDGQITDKKDWQSALRKESSVYEFIDKRLDYRLSQAKDYGTQMVVLETKPSLLFTIETDETVLKIWCDPDTYLPVKIKDNAFTYLVNFSGSGPKSIDDLIEIQD